MTSTVPAADRAPVAIDASAFDALRACLRGSLLLPGQPGYDDARSVWNAMIDRRPAAIARCLGVADVVACISFARENGIALSVKGGGHNISGLAVCDGGLMLDMSLMRGVWVDPPARRAVAQAGCLLGDVDRETQLHGLAAILGFVSNTGIAGLTLGGGIGYLTRRFGWTCDSVGSMELVTADGRIVRVSESEHADLFWALRGGGGNFGVVTHFEYDLYEIGPEIVGGAVAWRAEEAPEVIELFTDLVENGPPELTCVLTLRPAPPAPWLNKEDHGKRVALLMACHTGPIAEGERAVRRIKSFGSPIGDIMQRRSYVSQQSLLDATQPKGRRYYWKSEYLPRLEPEVLAKFLEYGQHFASPHSLLALFPVGGAIQRGTQTQSAVGNRDASVMFNILSSWEDASADDENIEWARAAWRDMRRFSTGGTYVNFLTEDEGDERVRAAYGPNYDRLVDVKTVWDPGNLFRVNKNIAPRTR